MKKILFILFTLFTFSLSAQAPIKLTSIEASPDTGMTVITKDTLGKKLQRYAQPRWLETVLPFRSVNINANRNNFIISNGIIGSFATDTTTNGWILQSYVSGVGADGIGKIGGRNYLTGKVYGLDFNGASGTVLSGYTGGVKIANNEVQDSTLDDSYNYVPMVRAGNTRTGLIDYVRDDSVGTWLKPQLESGNDVDIETENLLSIYSSETLIGFETSLDNLGDNIVVQDNGNEQNGVGISRGRIAISRENKFKIQTGLSTDSLGVINFSKWGEVNQGDTLSAIRFDYSQEGADYYSEISSYALDDIGVDTSKGTSLAFSATPSGTQSRITQLILDGNSITIPTYPNTRNDAGNPVNILATSAAGVEESHALAGVFETISAQSHSDQILASDVAATVLFQYVNQNTTGGMSIQGDTVVLIPSTGTYSANVQCSAEASLSDESTTIQFVGTNIADLGFNQPITIAAGGNGSSFGLNRVFTTSAANATLRFRVGASTWTSGSVFINAGCSLTVERKY